MGPLTFDYAKLLLVIKSHTKDISVIFHSLLTVLSTVWEHSLFPCFLTSLRIRSLSLAFSCLWISSARTRDAEEISDLPKRESRAPPPLLGTGEGDLTWFPLARLCSVEVSFEEVWLGAEGRFGLGKGVGEGVRSRFLEELILLRGVLPGMLLSSGRAEDLKGSAPEVKGEIPPTSFTAGSTTAECCFWV